MIGDFNNFRIPIMGRRFYSEGILPKHVANVPIYVRSKASRLYLMNPWYVVNVAYISDKPTSLFFLKLIL